MKKVIYRAEVFRENELYVGVCPDLNVSSFGENPQEARSALREAVEAFLESCESLGTLEQVLEESGFSRDGNVWHLRERVTEDAVATLS